MERNPLERIDAAAHDVVVRAEEIPVCPADRTPLTATVVGWRCPVCGLAALRTAEQERERARARSRADHPSCG